MEKIKKILKVSIIALVVAFGLTYVNNVQATHSDEFKKELQQNDFFEESDKVTENKINSNSRAAIMPMAISDFPSGWTNHKKANSISGMQIGRSGGNTEYSFTPIQGGRPAVFGNFSFTGFGGDSTCKMKKLDSDPNTNYKNSMFKKQLDGRGDGITTTPSAVEFNIKSCPDNYKGKIGVRYNNIGYYKGDVIDMKITITGWTKPSATHQNNLTTNQYGFRLNKSFGIAFVQMNSATVNYSFFKQGTETPINLKGYWTFTDIDDYQSVQVAKTKITGNQWIGKQNILWSANNGTNQVVYEKDGTITSGDVDPITKTSWGHEFNATNVSYVYRDNKFINNNKMIHRNIGFGYVSENIPDNIITYNPEKYISTKGDLSGTDEEKQQSVTSMTTKDKYTDTNDLLDDIKKYKTFNYHIVQDIPYVDSSAYYKSFVMEDEILPEFEIDKDNIFIYSTTKKASINDYFDIEVDENNKLTVTAKDSSLTKADFYGTQIFFKIPVKLKSDKTLNDLSKYLTDKLAGTYEFPNTASVTIDGDKKDTQTVIIEGKVEPDPYNVKSVDKKEASVGDILTYSLEVGNKEKTGTWYNARLEDVLPDYLELVKDTTTVDGEETKDDQAIWSKKEMPYDVNGDGKIDADEKATLDVLNRALGDVEAGKSTKIVFQAKLTKTPPKTTDKGTPLIENTLTSTGDNGTPPPADVETPTPPKPGIEKTNEAGFVVVGQDIEYTIKVKNSASIWLDVVVSDKLKDYLTYQGGSTKVSNIVKNDKDLKMSDVTDIADSDNTEWDIQNQKLTVRVGDLKKDEYVVIKFKAKLNKAVDLVENTAEAIGTSEFPPETPIPGVDTPIDDSVKNTRVEITKVDVTNSKEIPGANLKLMKVEKDKKETLVDKWISTKEAHVMYLTEGRYNLYETIAPKGYLKIEVAIPIIVDASGKVKKVPVDNKPVKYVRTGGLNYQPSFIDKVKDFFDYNMSELK